MSLSRPLIAPNNQHLEAVGRITAYWTLLEDNVEKMIWRLASLEQSRGRALTTHMESYTRLEVVQTLVDLVISDIRIQKRLKNLINKIQNKLRPERNEIVHALWTPTNNKEVISIFRTTAKGCLNFKSIDKSISDLEAFADKINEANTELFDLLFAIAELVPPSTLKWGHKP